MKVNKLQVGNEIIESFWLFIVKVSKLNNVANKIIRILGNLAGVLDVRPLRKFHFVLMKQLQAVKLQ